MSEIEKLLENLVDGQVQRRARDLEETLARLCAGLTRAYSGLGGQIAAAALKAATGLDGLTRSAGGAEKAAKRTAGELRGVLAGFDQLNVLKLGAAGESEDPLPEAEPDPALTAYLTDLAEALAPFEDGLGEGLRRLYEDTLVPLSGWTPGPGPDGLRDSLSALSGVAGQLAGTLNALMAQGLGPVGAWDGSAGAESVRALSAALAELSAALGLSLGLLAGLAQAAADLTAVAIASAAAAAGFSAALSALAGPFGAAAALAAALTAALALLTGGWERTGLASGSAFAAVQSAWAGAWSWFQENVTGPLTEGLWTFWTGLSQWATDAWTAIQEVWSLVYGWFYENVAAPLGEALSGLWTGVGQWGTGAWTAIQKGWSGAWAWFEENVAAPMGEGFDALWSGLALWATDAWTGIQGVWSAVSAWFGENVTAPLGESFAALWTGVGQWAEAAWAGVRTAFSGAAAWVDQNVVQPVSLGFKGFLNGLIGFAEGFVNTFIRGVNGVISAFNSIRVSIPAWVPGVGGSVFGLNLPLAASLRLPRLANGAVIPPNRQFAAILGDQRSGVNIEAPAALIRETVEAALREAGGSGELNVTVVTQLDGREVARNTLRHLNDMTREAGKPVLLF